MTPTPHQHRSHHRTRRAGVTLHRTGFTLVEALTAIVIVATLLVIASNVIFAGVDAYAATATRARVTAEMSSAMERASVALRDIPMDTGQATAKPLIQSVTASSITWSTTSTLALTSGSLVLTTAADGAATLQTNVTGFTIVAYDQSGAALTLPLSGTACHAVQRLEISLTVARTGVTQTLRTRVFLRNLVETASPV